MPARPHQPASPPEPQARPRAAQARPRPNGHAPQPLEVLLGKLEGTRHGPTGWMARCPAHEDRQASLSLTDGTDGRALLKCHAGCTTEAVVAAMGLKMSDLYATPLERREPERKVPAPPARYQICDLAGQVVAIHTRSDGPDGKRMGWRLPDGSAGLGGLKTAELPLYGIHEAAEWDRMRPVVIAEGEKAAEALQMAGFQAVGTVTGASGTPALEVLEPLRGRHVILWPDADEVGQEHMERIADLLRPLALSLRRVHWPEAPAHADAADLAAEAVARLVADSEWLTEELPQPLRASDIREPSDPDAYLIEGFIRPGTLIMLSGPPGAAKSWAAQQLALSAAVGLKLFFDHYAIHRKLRVLLVDEDNGEREEWRREQGLVSYLGLQRGDLRGLWRLSLADIQLDQERWQRWLRGLIEALELDLVILDPISEMHGGKELRDDPAFRSVLRFLKRLKVDYPHLAVLLVHHTRKRSGNERGAPASLDEVRGQWGQTPDAVAIMLPLGDRRASWELFKRVPHSKLVLEQQEAGGLQAVADQTTGPNKRESTDNRVLAAIDAGASTAEEVRIGTGLSSAGVYKALKRLAQAVLVTDRAPYRRILEPGEETEDYGGGTFVD